MRETEIVSHKIAASQLSEQQLVSIIRDLKKEKKEMEETQNFSEIKKYDTLIDIYTEELVYSFVSNMRNHTDNIH